LVNKIWLFLSFEKICGNFHGVGGIFVFVLRPLMWFCLFSDGSVSVWCENDEN
jgi:hypothetical protein